MNVSFYLTRPAANSTSIYARLCYSGYKFKFYIPETIDPVFWNRKTQRATKKFREHPEFNTRLNNIESAIKNVYRKYINDNSGTIPNPETFKALLNTEIKKTEPEKEKIKSFLEFFEHFIDQTRKGIRMHPKTGKPINAETIKTYITTFNHLKVFNATRKKAIDFDNINLDFYSDYTEYLIKKVNLSTNTIGKHIQGIRLVMNEATERGLNKNLSFKSKRFAIMREKSDSIYLTEAEIKEIEKLDLSNSRRLDEVRDLFLIGRYTGMRWSDYSTFNPQQIKDGFIEITQTKTSDPVVIPIHPTVKKIIEKYSGKLPRANNQTANDLLKEIGKQIDLLKTPISKTFTKGGLKITENCQKWELLSTHTARRTFASLEYLAGTPITTIRAITGHKTEKAFWLYIKLTPSEHAQHLRDLWNERNQLRAV